MDDLANLVKLRRDMAAHLDGRHLVCKALGPDGCLLLLPVPVAAGRALDLDLETDDGSRLLFRGTAGEIAELADGAALQRFAIAAADDSTERALHRLISRLRKEAHLDLCAEEDVEARRVTTGLERFRLPHDALPDLDGDAIDLSVTVLGRRLSMPLIIAGMTGGSPRGGEINRALARVAARAGIGMGLGSQRAMLDDPEAAATFRVREEAPDVLLLANVGAVQLNTGVTPDRCAELVDAVEADALCVHLNALQEMIQPEGDRDFRGLAERIAAVVERLDVPVLLKETGCGMSGDVVRRALALGCVGVDVSGAGGTSWARVEALRQADPAWRDVGDAFRDWGVPTAEAVMDAREASDRALVIASGGVRGGRDMAVAMALGADVCAMALPLLRAVLRGEEHADGLVRRLRQELRVAMMCSGAGDVAALRRLPLHRSGRDGDAP